jgi:NDP-sugar pyrophosphorylase family protein
MQAVILAAGKGTRLQPITNTRSKAMLPILGKPIIERIIENLAAWGLRNFILVVSPEDQTIREYFQHETTLDVDIQFVNQARQMGTADALKQAAPYLNEDFVLSACDSLVPAEENERLISTWSKISGLQALLSLKSIPKGDSWKTGIVTLDGDQVTGIIEKPPPDQAPSTISSLPLYCFSLRILDYIPQVQLSPRGEYELQDAIQMMIDANENVRGLFVQNHLTLTTAEDLLELNFHFLNSSEEYWQITPHVVGVNTDLVMPLCIEPGVEIGSGCKIGPGVYIEKNARIGNYVKLENVVVLRQAVIPEGTELKNQVVTS